MEDGPGGSGRDTVVSFSRTRKGVNQSNFISGGLGVKEKSLLMFRVVRPKLHLLLLPISGQTPDCLRYQGRS